MTVAQIEFGGNWLINVQPERESADGYPLGNLTDDSTSMLCECCEVADLLSKRTCTHCRYRYPSPHRSGSPRVRPIPLHRAESRSVRGFGLMDDKRLELTGQTSDSAPNKTKQNKGSIQWLNLNFFSLRRLCCRFLRASTTILSAALPVQPQALSSQMQLGAMSSRAPSLGVPLAPCATRSHASAAKRALGRFSRPLGGFTRFDRRSGSHPCGGFSFLTAKTEG